MRSNKEPAVAAGAWRSLPGNGGGEGVGGPTEGLPAPPPFAAPFFQALRLRTVFLLLFAVPTYVFITVPVIHMTLCHRGAHGHGNTSFLSYIHLAAHVCACVYARTCAARCM